jgi:uncharacterized protein YebE (UPF0316 family)
MEWLTLFWQEQAWWLLPVLIFSARVADVSIGTLRIIFLSRGMKLLAPFCGFFEVLIWLMAIGQIMQNLGSWTNFIAFAAGFTAGNYVGMLIEEWLAVGLVSVWVITPKDASALIQRLKDDQYGLTSVAARGVHGKVRIIILIIKRKNLAKAQKLIEGYQPGAFISVKDIRRVKGGYFPFAPASAGKWRRIAGVRKGK